MQNGKYEEAITYFKKSFDKFSGDVNFLYNLANCYYQIGEYKLSIDMLDELINIDESYEDAYNLKAACFVHLSCFDEALNCLDGYLEKYSPSQELLNHKKEIEILNNISKKGKIQVNLKEHN